VQRALGEQAEDYAAEEKNKESGFDGERAASGIANHGDAACEGTSFDAAERELRVENQDSAEVGPEFEAAQADAIAEIQEFY